MDVRPVSTLFTSIRVSVVTNNTLSSDSLDGRIGIRTGVVEVGLFLWFLVTGSEGFGFGGKEVGSLEQKHRSLKPIARSRHNSNGGVSSSVPR